MQCFLNVFWSLVAPFLRLLFLVLPWPAAAESLVAARTLPAQTVIAPGDVMLVDAAIPDALTEAQSAVGLETRVAIYAGRPVRAGKVTRIWSMAMPKLPTARRRASLQMVSD